MNGFLKGDLSRFGANEVSMEFDINQSLTNEIIRTATSKGILVAPLDKKTYENYGVKLELDHGAIIPLYYIAKDKKYKLVHITYGILPKLKLYKFEVTISESGICIPRKAIRDESGETILVNYNYEAITSIAVDPIEKKPLYNFYPGNNILSVGTFGCNFKCSFCQNYNISQQEVDYKRVISEELVDAIISVPNNIRVAFTYNEPFIWYEYILETAKLLKEKNKDKKVVLVINGYVNKEPLENIIPYIDAMNIDLKGNEKYYKSLCKATLEPVLKTIEIVYQKGIHIEVTTLLVSDENTDEESIIAIRDYLSDLDTNIPLHIKILFYF
ncbi:radical SAM protein [Romboutsia sp.]|uniref:radical SAM protein n=1 Tax=Romboutsia sp. TaxID=1965302 RepID=UPI003F2A6B2B